MNTLEEIYETEKTESSVLKIKKSPIVKSERSKEPFLKNISTKLNAKDIEHEPEVLVGLKKLAKRKYTVINSEVEVVSGYDMKYFLLLFYIFWELFDSFSK